MGKEYLYCLKGASTKESTLKGSSTGMESSLGKTFTNDMYYRANGKKYEGYWAYNLMHGKGTMIQANGNVREGVWNNNGR